jgi:hypothetical protein
MRENALHERVTCSTTRRITGAATSTTGNMVSHEISHTLHQWLVKVPSVKKDTFAIADAMAQVNPD